jgi:hypothetical protein
MQSLASLLVSLVVLAVVGAGESRARPVPVDRTATIAAAVSAPSAAAPLAPDLLPPCALTPSLRAPVVFASSLPRALVPAPQATAPLYLRHRALLL